MKISGKSAVKYAKSIYASLGVQKVEALINELTAVNRLMTEERQVRSVFMNPFFSGADRMKTLDVISKSFGLGDSTKRFIASLIKAQAIKGLPQIISILTALYREGVKAASAVVTTAVALTGEQALLLKKTLGQRLNREVTIENVIDPTIIGGLTAKVGNLIIDTSIKGQLRLLKESLTKE